MAERYELVIQGGTYEEVTGDAEAKQPVEPKAVDEITEKQDPKMVSQMVAKGIGVTTLVYGMSANIIAQTQANANQVRGDAVLQRRLDNTMAYVNESVGVFGSLAVGGAVGGIAGIGAVLGAQAIKWSMKAINMSIQTERFVMEVEVNKNVNRDRQDRFIKNITGVRI